MKDKYKIDVYGRWEFTVKKLIHGRYCENYFITYGHITRVDEVRIEIEDCDVNVFGEKIKHRIVWDRLIDFEKQERPDVCLLNK